MVPKCAEAAQPQLSRLRPPRRELGPQIAPYDPLDRADWQCRGARISHIVVARRHDHGWNAGSPSRWLRSRGAKRSGVDQRATSGRGCDEP